MKLIKKSTLLLKTYLSLKTKVKESDYGSKLTIKSVSNDWIKDQELHLLNTEKFNVYFLMQKAIWF